MSGLEVLGVGITPAFTERMTFTDLEHIDFAHEPARRRPASAPASTGGTTSPTTRAARCCATSLEVVVELPLPRLSAPGGHAAMKGVMATMGDRFSRNLLDHLGVEG